MTKRMWMVRAGEGAVLIDRFKNENRIVIGWEVGDLSNVHDAAEIKKLLKDKFPERKPGQINISASQISKFRFEFQIGDNVISYDPQNRIYLVGEITSDYIFDDKFFPENRLEYCDTRNVKWFGEVNRDILSTSTKNTLGAISTIFEINSDAANEILNALTGNKPPEETSESEDEELDTLKEDIAAQSHEFIKDKILELGWEEMQELVAGVLRGMGYKTIVSARGPDRGRDIIASPDGLGLSEPRIVVEVKHRKGQMGSPEIRSFTGGMRPGDKGLYISTGGYSKEAKYEAERSNNPVTLVDSDMLVNLIIQYYDKFDTEARSLIPLTKIYWPT
jgi:restriction system protein